MAVLNKIRQRSVFLIVIIALALFSFVLADLFRNGGAISQKAQNIIATINGEDIDRTEFAQKVENASRGYGANGSTIQAVNRVWNQEIRSVLFNEQFEEVGLRAGADQMNQLLEDALANNPTFQNDAGVFDRAKMQEYVASVKGTAGYQQWQNYKVSLGKDALQNTYLDMIKAGVGVTLKEGELAYKMENDKVDIKYVQIPYTTIPDTDVQVSDAEIKEYINKNASQYQTDATRNLRYVFFKEEPSEVDEKATEKEVAGLISGLRSAEKVEDFIANQSSATPYDNRFVFKKGLPAVVADTLFNVPVGQVYGPYKDGGFVKISKIVAQKQMHDSLKASHILVSWKGLNTARGTERSKEDAKKLADSLLALVKADKSKFTALAKDFSADTSNKDKGGDLGYFPEGRMVPEFNDYVAENNVGHMGVVETAFGYHIISIEDKKNTQKAVQVATVSKEIEPSEETISDIFTETTKFQMATKDADFEATAKEKKYEVRPVNKLSELAENVPGLGLQRSIVRWAFEEEAKIGDVKRFDVKDGYAVVQLTGKEVKGTRSVADASLIVKPKLIKEKKAAMLKAKISATTLDEIAKNQSQTVKTASAINLKTPTISGAGTEPKVAGTAFMMEAGQVSAPIVGNSGVYVVEVTKVTPASGLDTYMSYASQQSKTNANSVNSRVYNALKDAAEIEDKRANFY